MLHSLSVQVSYYSAYIQKQPEWLYCGVYVDEAVTGTKTERPEFQRLLADCRAGKIAGLAAVGKVYEECMIIAYGEGRNGKSTFWNSIMRVLGSYSGTLSADALTVGCRRNVKPEMAELKGKRLIITSELEEGMRLNNSMGWLQ